MLTIKPHPEMDATFVKIYLQTGDALDACIRSGFKVHGHEIRTVAEYLLERPDMQLAIAAASAARSSKSPVEITRDSIISDLEEIHSNAMIDKEYSPAIAAKKLQAQLAGHLVDNVQITHKMDPKMMTDEEIIRLMNIKRKQIEAPMIDITPQPKGLGQVSHEN
jgi:hypothetical protein